MGGLSNFDKMITYFSERGYKVYVPQLPIYDLPVLNTNFTSIAKYVARFIKDKIGQPVNFNGEFYGGHIVPLF